MDEDIQKTLQHQVQEAAQSATPLRILGGDSKRFYGREPLGEPLTVSRHRGIIHYEPTELVLTARAGTPLTEIEATLADQGQILGFDPPRFGDSATLGGAVASGLAGPSRPYTGGVRDFVLGTTVLTGKGEVLHFGGEVMKNVAGYDISRLMCGALGTLGVLLDISVKVLPRPAREQTLTLELDAERALATLAGWSHRPLPLSGACHDGQRLYLRLSGAGSAVAAARDALGGEPLDSDFWQQLRDHRLAFFQRPGTLWRLALPPGTPVLALPGDWLLDWGGTQRWLISDAGAQTLRAAAAAAGGHATAFRGADRDGEVFHPLEPGIEVLHRRLKEAFDPRGILNPGRMYGGHPEPGAALERPGAQSAAR